MTSPDPGPPRPRATEGAVSRETTGSLQYQPRILIAEDNEQAAQQLRTLLEGGLGLRVDLASDGKQALEALRNNFYSVFLTDLKMPRVEGMELIQQIEQQQIPVTVIVMTGHGSIDSAVEAMRLGAYDFLTKPLDIERLEWAIKRALRERSLRDEVVYLREQLKQREAFAHIVTKSPQMMKVLELIQNIAQTTTTVLIEGETGTGKEMVARAIHQASASLRAGPLVALNCAALPENLLESELFGHEKGAFTGAISQRKGRFEQAEGGTLFLDEVGEIPPTMQVKLLRVLQERTFERVGGSEPLTVDVRVIAATNRSLARMVKKGRFREDLYYRINVVRIELPPLRERPEDVRLLANHFCEKYARPGEAPQQIGPEAMEALLKHPWPGNVRELESVIERACVTCQERTIGKEHLGPEFSHPAEARTPFKVDLTRPLPVVLKEITTDVERRYIRKALRKTHGNVWRCAQICGMSRRSITAKLAEYNIDRKEMKDPE